jgi:hypothetical protein
LAAAIPSTAAAPSSSSSCSSLSISSSPSSSLGSGVAAASDSASEAAARTGALAFLDFGGGEGRDEDALETGGEDPAMEELIGRRAPAST